MTTTSPSGFSVSASAVCDTQPRGTIWKAELGVFKVELAKCALSLISEQLRIPGASREVLLESAERARGVERFAEPVWLHPLVSWFCTRGKRQSEGVHFSVEAVLEALASMRTPIEPSFVVQSFISDIWVEYGLRELSRELVCSRKSVRLCDKERAIKFEGLIREAFELISNSWPAAASQVFEIARVFVLVETETRLQSSSNPWTFGAIYLAPDDSWTVLRCADLIVHEVAHHSLEVKRSFDPLLENPDSLLPSPLRRKKRPAEAVLHATFVLVRLICFLERYRDVFRPQGASLAEVDGKLAYYGERVQMGISSLKQGALWTAIGLEFFRDLERVLQDLGFETCP